MTKSLILSGPEVQRAIKYYLQECYPDIYKLIDPKHEPDWSLEKEDLHIETFEVEELTYSILLENRTK